MYVHRGFNYGYTYMGVRLKNSQILANLGAKLSHLAPEQQSDMSTLISEYSHLFPDVPGRTDVIFHDVDVGNCAIYQTTPI